MTNALGLLLLLLSIWVSEAQAAPKRTLILFGGGERPARALGQFVGWAGGASSRILGIAWASQAPESGWDSLASDLRRHGAVDLRVSLSPPMTRVERAEFLNQLSQASGVFFSGGDQSRIMNALEGSSESSALREALVLRYVQGAAFAGTSAGMAIMSPRMLTGDTTPLRAGLGLLPRTIVDSHFLKRQREERLSRAVAHAPELLGIGVDEGAALAILDDEHARVLGPEQVMIIDAREGATAPRREILQPDSCYALSARRLELCQALM